MFVAFSVLKKMLVFFILKKNEDSEYIPSDQVTKRIRKRGDEDTALKQSRDRECHGGGLHCGEKSMQLGHTESDR